MKHIKEWIKNIDTKMKILLVLACAYVCVWLSFQQADAETVLVGYEPAIQIKITDGTQKSTSYLVKRTTLENVLKDLDIELGEEDKTSIPLTNEVVEGSEVKITRVTYEEERVSEEIAYSTTYVDSTDTSLFGTRLVSEGEVGTREKIYRKKLVDGKEVDREEIGSEVIKEPVNRVVERGTATTGVTFSGKLTRYGADCIGCGTRTAAGLYVTTNGVKNSGKVTLSYNGGEYYVLAADSSIPFGTIIKVSNHNYSLPDPFYGIVLDRGGAVTGTTIDVFCGSESASFFSGGTSYQTQFEIMSMGSGATGIY